jgi:hypothetical protein
MLQKLYNYSSVKMKYTSIIMAALNPPFFFRIYSPNGQGIVYRADRDNGDSYMCTGSRQIGQSGRSIIWEVGGYADAMPREAMHSILGKLKPMTKAQTTIFVDDNGLAAKYKTMSLYRDSHGYWFTEKSRSRSRSSSPKSPKSRGRSKSRANANVANSKAKGRSKSRGRKP